MANGIEDRSQKPEILAELYIQFFLFADTGQCGHGEIEKPMSLDNL